jgi:flagellin-like protein
MNKKGISPLIATVLLISFSVALGTMVMSIGRQVADTSGECEGVILEIQQLNKKAVLCYDTIESSMNVILKNIGSTEVNGIKMRVIDIDEEINEVNISNSKILVGGIFKKNIPCSNGIGVYVEFIPSVMKESGEIIYCPGKSVSMEGVPVCSA